MLSLGRGQEDTGMLASGLTCSAPTPQNGQRTVWCIWPFCGDGTLKVKEYLFIKYPDITTKGSIFIKMLTCNYKKQWTPCRRFS